LDGRDLRQLPLLERKECLKLLLPSRGVVRYGDHIPEHGEAFFEAAQEQRLEGIVAKRVKSRYTGGRSGDWLKLKCQRRQEFVIGGYTDPQGSRGYFGALHLGLYEGGRLLYVSKVGTGFDQEMLKRVWARLQSLSRPTPPFEVGAPAGRGHHWVEPKVVCEVRFSEWTRDGGLRHPAFLGLGDDRRPEECRRERPVELVAPPPSRPEEGRPKVIVTNPTKLFWPDEGYTKADLIAYYEGVAPLLLPYLRDRPLVLTRYPDGIAGKSFFQKDAPDFVPAWVRTDRIYSKDAEREIDYFIVNDADSLRYVTNLATIPLHLWSSRLGSLDRPDWLILDLDPKGAPFTDVVKVARALHRILEPLELPSYVKTSGATGLHILIPLGARYSHEEARSFGRLLALLGVEAEPELATVARSVRARGGKVYIDFVQNGHGRTIVAPFSVRPLPGAPVSCPLRWEEVTTRLDPRRFTIKTAPGRFRELSDPLAPVLKGAIDMAAALFRIQERLGARGAR
ncbi:MAG: DNA ligase D, partial [Candidatus Rokubacteria bacterium]|nr:DNA ligase D [Candidatus Rokubacteria bacterium]